MCYFMVIDIKLLQNLTLHLHSPENMFKTLSLYYLKVGKQSSFIIILHTVSCVRSIWSIDANIS